MAELVLDSRSDVGANQPNLEINRDFLYPPRFLLGVSRIHQKPYCPEKKKCAIRNQVLLSQVTKMFPIHKALPSNSIPRFKSQSRSDASV